MFQDTLFPPENSWRAPRLADLPPDWNVSDHVSIDTETRDDQLTDLGCGVRRGGYVVGYSFALNTDRGYYVPMRHLGGDNVGDPVQALRYLKDQAAAYTGWIVGAKLDYDLDYLAELGITFPNCKGFKDVQVAEPLIDELQFSYSLDNILKRHGLQGKMEDKLREAAAAYKLHPKKDMWKLPGRHVGEYAEGDVTLPLQLIAKQEAVIAERGLDRVWALEQAVTPILVKMRRRGVRIDFDQLEKVERWSIAQEMNVWGDFQRLSGVAIRVGDGMKAEVLAHALERLDIVCPRTAKGKPSINKMFLESLPGDTGKLIRRGRQMGQLRSTFVNSIRRHAVGDRIHCTFNQIVRQDDDANDTEGAAFGRLSCVDPNLQQQPARDPVIGPMWRKIYVPDGDGLWGCLDWSQQEPKLAVHFATKSKVDGPFGIGHVAHASAMAAAQRYWDDPTADSHTMFTAMVHGEHVYNLPKDELKLLRDPAKNIYLGICYGMGEAKMCHQIGLPTIIETDERSGRRWEAAGPEGKALLSLINQRVPYVKSTAKAVERVAKDRGFVKTLYGRQLHFPTDSFGNYDWTHKAFNRVIQGSAADMAKQAMIDLDRAGMPLQLQVHDEYDLTLASVAQGRECAEIMMNCVKLAVPFKVDLEIGPSWGEIKLAA